MAKTNNSISGRGAKVEIVVSATMVTALSTLTTAEDIDIGSICTAFEQAQVSQRDIDELFVFGSPTDPIVSQDEYIQGERYNVTIVYTQGKESLGTDTIDIYSDLLLPAFLNATPLSIQHKWSPAGGATGDEEYATSAAQTFVTSLPKPVPSTSSNKILVNYTIYCPPVPEPTVIA